MDDQEPGWNGGTRFPEFTKISREDYVTTDPSLSTGALKDLGLSPGKIYKALDINADSLTGDLIVELVNDAGERAPYPADFFGRAPAEKALMLTFPREGWMDGSAGPPGGKYENVRTTAGAAFTEERPDTDAYERKRGFNPNDFHAPSIAQAFDDMLPEDHEANWKSNSKNLSSLNESCGLIYGYSKKATADGSLDPELMRHIGITPGESYKVTGYVDGFLGENGVTIVNDFGKLMTYKASLFKQ